MSLASYFKPESRKRFLYGLGASVVAILVTAGVFASNGWFPRTDPMSGKRYGWFGEPLAKNAPGSWNPVASAPPSATPQLSKEYIHAGSRLLSVEDKNATAAAPSDLAVWRPTSGVWYVNNGTTWMQQAWGQNGDTPVPGDFDGDGKTDFSIFRPGTPYATWYIIHSSTGSQVSFPYAVSSDLPAQADYDGDGKTDAAIYRPPTSPGSYGVWHIQGTTYGYYTYTWGETDDIPAPADYDGDGRADVAVFRSTNRKFYSIQSSNQYLITIDTSFNPSNPMWETVSADYDGDGKADYAVYNRNAANWYIRSSMSGTFPTNPVQWGAANDLSVYNDYDGDGKVDLAVWTPSGTNVGRWHIKNSSNNSERNQVWGEEGDKPVPAFYRRF